MDNLVLRTYEQSFNDAIKFTIDKGFSCNLNSSKSNKQALSELISEISVIFANETSMYEKEGFNPIERFSIDCGNVHYAILNFIENNYPSINANITVGDVFVGKNQPFPFNESKCADWLINGIPKSLDFHTWITIDDDYILDCTIGTYINIRTSLHKEKNLKDNIYGGLIYGNEGNLAGTSFKSLNSKVPKEISDIKYIPIVIGRKAFLALAAKYKK
ncbi:MULTISPECIES: hypothetical protein [Psychrobacter]|uniref:Uncharacterized protein n=1 Tax=Psychrobacter alimentarius TaxID=261164 RepID=A0ABM6A1J6_9GAMM|nr:MULTISPECIES: hypothetical protein [Psychrobacter]AMT98240.1 hypothetical protein A3K91_2670 [Psychrobacter alimentarius]QCB29499.1 hypothetical protein E5677_00035 [Psychrobacter sp. PAMC27889]